MNRVNAKVVMAGFAVAALCLVGLSGCGNTLFFASEGKVAIDISAGEDPSQPVSVLIGYSRKVIAFVPPKNPAEDNEGTHSGEALSMISHFAAGTRDIGTGARSTSFVEHAFISGEAAKKIAGFQPAAVQNFLESFQVTELRSPPHQEAYVKARDCVREQARADASVGESNDSVELDQLRRSMGFPDSATWGAILEALVPQTEGQLTRFVADHCG